MVRESHSEGQRIEPLCLTSANPLPPLDHTHWTGTTATLGRATVTARVSVDCVVLVVGYIGANSGPLAADRGI